MGKVFDIQDHGGCIFCDTEFDIIYQAEQVKELAFCTYCSMRRKVSEEGSRDIERVVRLLEDHRDTGLYETV